MPDATYEHTLTEEARDLVALARDDALPPAEFRAREVAAVLEALDRGRSALLIGPAGVGKTAVIHEVARAMAARKSGALFEVSTVLLLSGTRYIGEWQTKVTRLANAAAERKAALYFTDIAGIATVGKTVQTNTTMLDALRPFVGTLDRLTRLRERADALRLEVRAPSARARVAALAGRAHELEAALDEAERELLRMGWDGSVDALVEVRPVGGTGRPARDLLVQAYLDWAGWARRPVDVLREPREDEEPALLGVQGLYAFGLLRGEARSLLVRVPGDCAWPCRSPFAIWYPISAGRGIGRSARARV